MIPLATGGAAAFYSASPSGNGDKSVELHMASPLGGRRREEGSRLEPSQLSAGADVEAVERIFRDLPPHQLIGADGIHGIKRLLEGRVGGRELVIEREGGLAPRLHDGGREGPQFHPLLHEAAQAGWIWARPLIQASGAVPPADSWGLKVWGRLPEWQEQPPEGRPTQLGVLPEEAVQRLERLKIGRASCRERV